MNAPSDMEILRAAALMIKQHGDAASSVARQRAAEFGEKKDLQGAEVWRRMVEAIDLLDAADKNRGQGH